jgi:hypothetical protein
MQDQPILKKTFYTVAIMLAAWVAFVGTVSAAAVLITSHVVGGSGADTTESHASSTDKVAPAGAHQAGTAGPGAAPQQRI